MGAQQGENGDTHFNGVMGIRTWRFHNLANGLGARRGFQGLQVHGMDYTSSLALVYCDGRHMGRGGVGVNRFLACLSCVDGEKAGSLATRWAGKKPPLWTPRSLGGGWWRYCSSEDRHKGRLYLAPKQSPGVLTCTYPAVNVLESTTKP